MDFNRSGQARVNTQAPVATAAPAPQKTTTSTSSSGKRFPSLHDSKTFRWTFIALLFSATALFVAMLFYIVFGTPISREARYVNKGEMQAVFVNVNGTNGGQVYFGNITDLNSQYIHLTKVFYIQNQQSQSASSAYNLVKLGCELHGPEDEMIINRSQVFFWENLKNDSQVAQKAAEFYKQNPNGQKCTSTSNSTQQSSGTTSEAPSSSTGTTGNASTGATTTAPSTNTSTSTTKKP